MAVTNDSTRYIAYICPFCSEICRKNVNIFTFSNHSPLELLCTDKDCGEECVIISRNKDKFKIEIECPACGETHIFKISSQSFLFKELLTFSCPECNINVFFAGNKKAVEDEVLKNCDKLSEMAEQFDFATEELNIMYRIIDSLHHLIRKNKIICSCGSSEIIPDVQDGNIMLSCHDCGKSVFIRPDEQSLEILEHSDGFRI